jgi:hypothetical protein
MLSMTALALSSDNAPPLSAGSGVKGAQLLGVHRRPLTPLEAPTLE